MTPTREPDRRVSVVIPTYNRREWVARAVESVLGQTQPADEILIVDDGSSDGTAGELSRRFGDAVQVLSQPNRGVAAARNLGLRTARFGLVAFLDSDDTWHKRKLEIQLPTLDDSRIVLSLTNWAWRKDPGRDVFTLKELQLPSSPYVDHMPLATLSRPDRALFLVQTAIGRKDALLRVGGFDERMRFAEDTRLLLRLAFEGPFAVVSETLMLREEGDSERNLSLLRDPASRDKRNRASVEALFEAYARAIDAPYAVQRELRRLVAYHVGAQARLAAEQGHWRLARRRAFEALAFGARGRIALRCAAGLISPRLMRLGRPYGVPPTPPRIPEDA